MTEQKARDLCAEHRKLTLEMERAQNRNETRMAAHYEGRIARIEDELKRHDIDPSDYDL